MTTIRRILRTSDDVARQRKVGAARQKYQCPICRSSLVTGRATLDHSHKNGHCRSVLCNSCNVGEGKVLAAIKFRTTTTNLAYKDPTAWLRNLARYWEHHEANPSGIIHPTFDLEKGKQRPIKRKKKR